MRDEERLDDWLEREWREWAERPPRKSPQQAAQEVAQRLTEEPRGRQSRWLLLAAAAMILCCASLALFWHRAPGVGPEIGPVEAAGKVVPEGQVLMWLDEETPLYMTFQPTVLGEEENGGES